MRVKVELIVAGQVFTEEVRAVDYQEARQVALARNPNAKIISVTAVSVSYTHLTLPTIYSV